jgi:hypothetical protein
MKICTKCKIVKDESEFSKRAKSVDGLQPYCKECQRQYNLDHKEEIREHRKQYSQRPEVKQRKKESDKQYNLDHKEEKREYNKQYYEENKEEIKEYQKQYYEENKEEISGRHKQYNFDHKEEIAIYEKQYYEENKEENKEEIREYKKEYTLKRRKNDICFRLRGTVSASINHALRRNNGGKNGSTILDYLPYTIQQLREHLEKQFESWMSWNNHGNYDSKRDTWQIDHIIPLSSFHYQSMDCEEFQKCWSLTNLRPLKSIDNIKKSNKITTIKGQNNA